MSVRRAILARSNFRPHVRGRESQDTGLCEKVKDLFEDLIDEARGLPSLPSFTNAPPTTLGPRKVT